MEDHMARRASIYIGDDMQQYIEAHQSNGESVSGIINSAIDRLQYLIKTAEPSLTDAEWSLICDARTGAVNTPVSQAISGLVGAIEDAIALDGADKTHGVDGPALVAKLRDLDRLGRMAVVDRAERWWATQG
jgi:hypothetical protein